MTSILPKHEQEQLDQYGSTHPEFIAAVKHERRGDDAIDKAIMAVLTHPDIDVFEAFDIIHELRKLNRRNR